MVKPHHHRPPTHHRLPPAAYHPQGHTGGFNASTSTSRSPNKSHRAFGASLSSRMGHGRGARKEDLPVTMTVRSRHELTTSPFVQRWMEENQVRMPTGLSLKVGLTQDGYRPVLYKPRHSRSVLSVCILVFHA